MATNQTGTSKSGKLVPVGPRSLRKKLPEVLSPTLIREGGGNATFAYAEFFEAQIENPHTLRAYKRAVDRFLEWCEAQGFGLREIAPGTVSEYLRKHLWTKTGSPVSGF